MAFDPLSLVGSLGSGLLSFFGGQSAQDKAIAAQQAINAQNLETSKLFAKNSIKWRVQDANQSGIHPLYALGAPTMSFAPAQVGAAGQPYNSMAPLAAGLRDMGQDISRASSANVGPGQKVEGALTAQQIASNSLDLENKQLNNQLLKSRLALLTQPGTPPGVAFPVPESNKIENRPPLMAGGFRWDTNPNTSPQKAYEDQYGDDGPAAWITSLGILGNDVLYNMGLATRPLFSGASQLERWNANRRSRSIYGSGTTPY